MDSLTLSEAMGCSIGRATLMLPGYVAAMKAANITNPNRAAMFAAQIGHESTGLQDMEERASGADYEWRKDLGNNQPGDGPRFKGSGPIQLTGRNNFRAFTRWANAQGHTDIDFEQWPHLVREEPRWGFLAASWYWTVARPQLNTLSDNRDLIGATRAINGGTNGLPDRKARYNRCIEMGARLLPVRGGPVAEKVLKYPRDQILQDTFYNCGPASSQTVILSATGKFISEADLGRELRTHTGGTDWIGQVAPVLNRHIPGAKYKTVEMPHDPPGRDQVTQLWNNIVASINADHGVVINIQVPSSNYPKAVYPSKLSPAYSGGTVYHYIAAMGYSDADIRRVWIADSGFPGSQGVTGYWVSLDQLATMIPPKGYAYSTAPSKQEEGLFVSLPQERQEELARKIDRIHFELTNEFQSEVIGSDGKQSTWKGTLVGYILQADRKLESISENKLPAITKALDTLRGLFSKETK